MALQVVERCSCRIQATRQGREDTRLALFANVAIGSLGPIRKRFGPDERGNDRRVSPSEESAITCAVVPEAQRHERAKAIQRAEQSVGKNCAEDLVRQMSRTLYSRRFRVIGSLVKSLLLLPSRIADDVNSTIEFEFFLDYAMRPTTLILRGIELKSQVLFRARPKSQPNHCVLLHVRNDVLRGVIECVAYD